MTRQLVVAIVSGVLLFAPAGAGAASAPSGSLATNVTANPLRLGLTLSTSRTTVGSAVKAKGNAANLAKARFADVVVTIRVPSGISVAGSSSHDLGPLAGGATATTSWTLCAKAAGNYLVFVSGGARDTTGRTFTASSAALLLTVTAATHRCK